MHKDAGLKQRIFIGRAGDAGKQKSINFSLINKMVNIFREGNPGSK